ncbi:hypothetical protein GCM10022224_103400 [Nonomuraea antimicrobica]|uniref:Uncharacterized protein n=1 Tax=Nonomuraea antimicrobica TaxID=561173 RepID=A0ABP7EKV5_9ACTN
MTAARPAKRPAAAQDQPDTPPYYVATQALYIGAARAHIPGDQVPPAHVERFGWADKVRRPDEPPAVPPDQPVTDEGQAAATTEKER